MSEATGSLKRHQRLAGIVHWCQAGWSRYWRDLAEVAMLACFVGAGFWLHPVAGLVVLGLALFYVVALTGRAPVTGKDDRNDASSGQS